MLVNSKEYREKFDNLGFPQGEAVFPVDLPEGVKWAYRLILGREPSEDEVAGNASHVNSIRDIRRTFVLSREFELIAPDMRDLVTFEILNTFAPFAHESAPLGYFRDFMGTLTKTSHLGDAYAGHSARVESHPGQSHLHGIAEWAGTLRSVLDAGDKLVVIELGAGWAPWLVGAAFAAKKRGIDDICLIGVEGSIDHFHFMREHLATNGIHPDSHRLLHAVVGPNDGIARFPKLHAAGDDYGASASFGDETVEREFEEVRCIALSTLLQDVGHVDLIHIDIQGHEEVVIRSALATLNAQVRRMVIGTHTRAIEAALIDLLSENGWILEYEKPCVFRQLHDNKIYLQTDGEQVWRNSSV
jgi:FkbM family methyltransferase